MDAFMLEEQHTHKAWIEAKHYFQIINDDALANHLLELATCSIVSSEVSTNNVHEAHHAACFLSVAMGGRNYSWCHHLTHN